MIAYNNYLRSAAVLASSNIDAAFPIENAFTGRTGEQVGFTGGVTAEIDFDFGMAMPMRALCLARHNLDTVSATIRLSGSADNVTYTPFYTSVSIESPVFVHVFSSTQTYRYLKIEVYGNAATAYVADLFVGDVLDFPYGPEVGFVQPDYGDRDKIISNITGAGGIAGISTKKMPKRTKIPMKNFPESWFDSNWESLIESLKIFPAYYRWDASKKPMYFVMTGRAPQPKYSHPTRLSASIDIHGLV